MTTAYQNLLRRAEEAEKNLSHLQSQLAHLQNQHNMYACEPSSRQQSSTQIMITDNLNPNHNLSSNQIVSNDDDQKLKESLNTCSIPSVIYKIQQINNKDTNNSTGRKRTTMTVSICNGEPSPPFISPRGINWLKNNYVTTSKDVYVNSYAKCGTTLCINLVYLIYDAIGVTCDGCLSKDKMSDPLQAVPWPEAKVSQELYHLEMEYININSNNSMSDKVQGLKPIKWIKYINDSNKNKNSVRLFKTHAPWCNFPAKKINNGTKIIHITRNPKDVMCSYFNFFRQEPFVKYNGDFNTLFNWFCEGSVIFANFWQFELDWWRIYTNNNNNHNNNNNNYGCNNDQIFWITFEEILTMPHSCINNLATFLGVSLTETQIAKVFGFVCRF